MTTTVWGVDFSGAATPGDRLALAEASYRDGTLHIEAVDAVATRCETADSREAAIAGLVDLARRRRPARVGLDAALSLPQSAVRALGVEDWTLLPATVRSRCGDARALTKEVIDAAPATGPRYPRRVADAKASALSPVHFMIAAQTYAALTELLPRWRHVGGIIPHTAGTPALCEVYPAAALGVWGLDATGYKGPDPVHRGRRTTIVEALTATGAVRIVEDARDAMIDQHGGDLLDAAIAATVMAFMTPCSSPGPPVEGSICGADPTDYPSQCPLLPA
jgi:Protein of unknown function (DUF429).